MNYFNIYRIIRSYYSNSQILFGSSKNPNTKYRIKLCEMLRIFDISLSANIIENLITSSLGKFALCNDDLGQQKPPV